jgi:hypothetical protein
MSSAESSLSRLKPAGKGSPGITSDVAPGPVVPLLPPCQPGGRAGVGRAGRPPIQRPACANEVLQTRRLSSPATTRSMMITACSRAASRQPPEQPAPRSAPARHRRHPVPSASLAKKLLTAIPQGRGRAENGRHNGISVSIRPPEVTIGSEHTVGDLFTSGGCQERVAGHPQLTRAHCRRADVLASA